MFGTFPEGFKWGVATSAYQIEGGFDQGGRKPSVWDTFCDRGGVRTGESGRFANEHFHLFEEDARLMSELGIKHYRFSLAWPRIIPDGRGQVNEEGIDFYKRLLDALQENGITPYVTLFHWDTPQALEDLYGSWMSREIADDFADFSTAAVSRLGDRVTNWFTINEIPSFTHQSYTTGEVYMGMHAPGLKVNSQKDVHQSIFNSILAHGKSMLAVRAASPQPCKVGIVDNTGPTVPLTERDADIAAAQKAYQMVYCNGQIIFPILTGAYAPLWWEKAEREGSTPDIQEGDLKIISTPMDYIGDNVYSGEYVRAADNAEGFEIIPCPPCYPRMGMDWLKHVPESGYWSLRHLRDVLGWTGEVMITENGAAVPDEIAADGEIHDVSRIMYLRSYLNQFNRAIGEGINLTGYFQWSFMDNFEWSYGYGQRLGIVWNSFETQKRIVKDSGRWYAECIRQNRVV